MNIFIDTGGGCDVMKVKVIQCMVCNPDGSSNVCNNADDKGTLSKCSHYHKSCVKKVAKSKYTSGFSKSLPLNYLNFNSIEFNSNLII